MNLSNLWRIWRGFWFEPTGTETISVYRILFGLLVLQTSVVHLSGRFSEWYSDKSMITLPTVINHFWFREPRFDLMLLFPQQEPTFTIFYYGLVFFALTLTLGFRGRFSAMMVWLMLLSMHHHNPYNINGGDAFLRVVAPFLALSPCADHYSIDAWLRKRRGESLPEVKMPWAQRLIQVSIALAYWQTFWCKISGNQWLDGTAVYYATRLDDMLRFPAPWISDNMFVLQVLNWFTLIIEFLGWNAIFIKEFRYYVVVGLVFLHLGIDYMINLPVFEWAFIFTLFTFVEPAHVRMAVSKLKELMPSPRPQVPAGSL